MNDRLSFGPFRLIVGERLLTRDGIPVELGGRALDILIALVTKPNEVISKKDLMAHVWPDVIVEEGSLRFHMASLRKALGDGKGGARYIKTVPGRGYCFVATVSWLTHSRTALAAEAFPHSVLPSRLGRMVGRDEDVLKISAELNAARFVTIVGAGGVGKTTVAIAVGHHLFDAFAGAVLFVDLGMLGAPNLVSGAVASDAWLSVQSDDATPGLIAYLRNKRMLLILDTCEHLIEVAATLASNIADAAPQVHILATSREALCVGREHIYRLQALACPPEDEKLTAAMVQTFPATQLFVERAVAGGARLDVSDADALVVADICRKLDGVALAIELAARRVETYGLQQTAALLDQRLTLLWRGWRTAPPRQRTLQATLDWSFGLLTQVERTVFRRLGVFVGHFTLDAALEVVTDATLDRPTAIGAIDSLVAKSIVATNPIGATMRYRLLDTTRAYVLEIGIDDGAAADLSARHAAYYHRWSEQSGSDWTRLATGEERVPHFAAINNVRAALEWCFSANGNTDIGIALAAAAAPLFLAMSLLPECHRWSQHAIASVGDVVDGERYEMPLQAALGVSLMFTRGGRNAARVALERSFEIAERRGDALAQVRLQAPMNMFHLRAGDFAAAFQCAKRCSAAAAGIQDPSAIALAHSILGISLHLRGDLADARVNLEAALATGSQWPRTTTMDLGFEARILAMSILARNLWLQGYPDLAQSYARRGVEEATAMDHSLTLAIALIWATSVFLWCGQLEDAAGFLDVLVSRAESNSLTPYLLVAQGFKGEVAVRYGDAGGGVESLQDSLQKLHEAPYELLTTELSIALIAGLIAKGRTSEALSLINAALGRVETGGDLLYVPELLRAKATALLLEPEPSLSDAETCLLQALELSRRSGARAWELRAAVDLARLRLHQDRAADGRAVLQPIFGRFTEGLDTTDLKAAKAVLATLG